MDGWMNGYVDTILQELRIPNQVAGYKVKLSTSAMP
jgi:hypothetical protein